MADNHPISGLQELLEQNDDMEFLVNDNGVSKRIKSGNLQTTGSGNDLLTKIKTVDGVGSGLDADTLQSISPENLPLNGGYF